MCKPYTADARVRVCTRTLPPRVSDGRHSAGRHRSRAARRRRGAAAAGGLARERLVSRLGDAQRDGSQHAANLHVKSSDVK